MELAARALRFVPMLVTAAVVAIALAAGAWPARLGAQTPAVRPLAQPNAAGVSMGHLHYRVRDVAANRRFWLALGARPLGAAWAVAIRAGGGDVLALQDVLVVLERGESTGGTEGSVVNHVAFRVPALSAVEAAGLTVARLAQFPGVASVTSPEGERVELFENAATNLTFVADGGVHDAVSDRHNRPLTVPIAFHHIHLYVPDAAAAGAAKAWYARVFGGVPGKRSQYDATDVPGVNLNFSAGPQPTVPTKGRMLDHVGFEVVHLEAFCRRLEAIGVPLEQRYTKGRDGIGRAALTDPWGTSIELTEGFTGQEKTL
jgi:catechol 2,3-dioxygenase-like lactoylglutathione lyase family enzyme